MPDPGATAAANVGIGFLFTEFVKHIKAWKNVREDCDQLRRELDMCVAFMEDMILRDHSTHIVRAYDKEVRELAHDIEDCIERFMYRITSKDEARWHRGKAHAIWTWHIRWRFAKEMKKLYKRLQKAGADQIRHLREGAPITAPADERDFTKSPLFIDQAKEELLTLLGTVDTETEPARLRVISIVGFGGSGKTTLAHAAYTSAAAGFPLRAWVNRTEYTDASALLKIIIEKFRHQDKETVAQWSDKMRLQEHLKKLLGNQRYLIVLDDTNMKHWEWIEQTFRDNGTSSRIMVTVTTLPAANYCSSNQANYNGYVYQMRALGVEGSTTIARLTELTNHETQTLLQKCDGLPLALDSVGGHFRRTTRGPPTIQECETLCKTLGSFLHDNNPDPVVAMAIRGAEPDTFQHLRDMLMNNFASLSSRTLRDSLQYLGIFPDARHLNRNKITRRWVAEGYAPVSHPQDEQEEADRNFKLFVARNIIQPVGISTGRICRAPGILHEFVRDKSMSENFIWTSDTAEENCASTHPGRRQRHKRVRHFVVRGSNTISSGSAVNMDLSHIRSLTVLRTDNGDNIVHRSARDGGEVGYRSGSEGDGFFKFSKYKVIRVLDLEECTQVKNSLVENICKLWSLRYLSLGDNVNKVPKAISQLELLERLHLSKTALTELPVDIIRMPSLIHLSGKLMLPESEVSTQPQLGKECERSKLQTLSGIVARKDQGFLLLVPEMAKLRKVKICFSESTEPIIDLSDPLIDAIISYLRRVLSYNVPRSLCLDFKNLYKTGYPRFPHSVIDDRILSLGGNYYLTSLKLHLHDELQSSMPGFIGLLSGLERLCLSLTLVAQGLLSAISQNLCLLAHLKLKADRIDGDLEIHEGTFQTLETLCFEFRDLNCAIPKIHIRGVLPKLRSFQLICKNLADRCGIDINRIEKLQEIELHGDVSVGARQEWETAARKHRNRPNVLPFLCVDDPAGAAHYEVANAAAPVNQEAEIVPVADGAQSGDEFTDGLITSCTTSSTGNDDSPHPAKSVASVTHEDTVVCPDHSQPKVLNEDKFVELANKPQDCPMDTDEAVPDATIAVQPVREVSNHALDHNASNDDGLGFHPR